MRIEGQRESENVEDQRGMMGGRGGLVAGGGVGTIIIALLFYFFTGHVPQNVLSPSPNAGTNSGPVQQPSANGPQGQLVKFVKVVLADTEDVWSQQLPRQTGKRYRDPKLVLFTGRVQSACGLASTAVGPFYCPGDEKVYIDLAFCDELTRRFKAPGDFAEAYVIAHEVGHHVQNILGTTARVDAQRGRLSKEEYNRLSVRLELQADFYAGVWAHYLQKKNIVEPGDIDEALNAARAVGDDNIQKQTRGYVVPDSFTHGSSHQRIAWFKKGFQTGDVNQGDTFNARDLDNP